jgi:hypothetical protein
MQGIWRKRLVLCPANNSHEMGRSMLRPYNDLRSGNFVNELTGRDTRHIHEKEAIRK